MNSSSAKSMLLAVCLGLTALANAQPVTQAPADYVFRNGFVYTVDQSDSVQQAVAVRGGRIVYVGSDAGAGSFVGPNTISVDLKSRMMMPGLVDGHVHPVGGGAQLRTCSLQYLPLTREQFLQRIQRCLDESKGGPDEFLLVTGWYRGFMQPPGADADAALLDRLKTTRPIIVANRDGHQQLVNSRALALGGITDQTPNPPGGSIDRDANGKATGILQDAASQLVRRKLPVRTAADAFEDARTAVRALTEHGVTTVFDAATGLENLTAYKTLQDKGELTIRVNATALIDAERARDPAAAIRILDDLRSRFDQPDVKPQPGIRMRAAKIFLDGVIQAPAQTAGLLEPYYVKGGHGDHAEWKPGTQRGPVYVPGDKLDPLVLALAKAGYDAHIHAIGDRSVEVALNAFAHMRTQLKDSPVRSAIAHAELVHPKDYRRFADLNVVPVMSYQWAIPGPNSVTGAKDYLGPERFDRMEPMASLAAAGARLAYGSDWPVDQMGYWLALKGGISRSGDGRWGPTYRGKLNAEPGISRQLALRSITMNTSWEVHQENLTGSIETGKLADLIVLDRNFMQIPEDDIPNVKVLFTMIGGKVVYDAGVRR
jgi:predicted amidohydrolase YtcJ